MIVHPLVRLKNDWEEMGDTVMVNRVYVFPYKKFEIMNTESEISKTLAANLNSKVFTPYNNRFFFDDNLMARKYAEIFGIEPDKNWFEAFRIATEGQGDELRKINSLISSSLLSLLMFHKLFMNDNTNDYISIKLPNFDDAVLFDKCLFEVRNRVVRFPSCVDVALYSSKQNVMLFLESKFTEYTRVKKEEYYGKGYITLYTDHLQQYLSHIIETDKAIIKGKEKLRIGTKSGERYIEGVKQSISHLIGLTRGPRQGGTGYYPESYHDEYSRLYDKADKLYYGTILFDPRGMNVDGSMYEDYVNLYVDTIGSHGKEIVAEICKWNNLPKKSYNKDKEIEVLPNPLSYQDVFQTEPNKSYITNQIREFYSI